MVGINSAIYSGSGGSIGTGFAIPINMAKEILPQLKEGKVVRGWLGVMIQKITPDLKEKLQLKDEKGALVADVTQDGPAEKAGMLPGDKIVSVDGNEIASWEDLTDIVHNSADRAMMFTWQRNDSLYSAEITPVLEKLPDNPTIHYHLGVAYLGNNEKNLAEKELKKALSLQKDFPEAEEAKRILQELAI